MSFYMQEKPKEGSGHIIVRLTVYTGDNVVADTVAECHKLW